MQKAWVCCGAAWALCAGCEPSAAGDQRWPGPCRAEWVVHEVVEVAGLRWTTPVEQGDRRVMRYEYDAQGRPVRVWDDDNNDGKPESLVALEYDAQGHLVAEAIDRGADGSVEVERRYLREGGQGGPVGYVIEHSPGQAPREQAVPGMEPMGRIWQSCQGVCEYDEHGNLLLDRAADAQDVLRYDYSCWTAR